MRGTSVYTPRCKPSTRHPYCIPSSSRSSGLPRLRSSDAESRGSSSADGSGLNAGSLAPGGAVITEDVLARLRAAEEEAARLREQLAAVQGSEEVTEDEIDAPRRIDSGDLRRETLFVVDSERRNWLSEADVEFFTLERQLPGSATSQGPTDEEQAVVTKRLVLGIGAAVGLGAFALVPTSDLRHPAKPMSFYVVALLRVQSLLRDLKDVIATGEWGTLTAALSRINGAPNNIRDSLYSATALLGSSKARQQGEAIATELLDFLVDMDYNKYFDAMPKAVTGKQQAEFSKFSNDAREAALTKLDEFLELVPASDKAAAVQLASSYY